MDSLRKGQTEYIRLLIIVEASKTSTAEVGEKAGQAGDILQVDQHGDRLHV